MPPSCDILQVPSCECELFDCFSDMFSARNTTKPSRSAALGRERKRTSRRKYSASSSIQRDGMHLANPDRPFGSPSRATPGVIAQQFSSTGHYHSLELPCPVTTLCSTSAPVQCQTACSYHTPQSSSYPSTLSLAPCDNHGQQVSISYQNAVPCHQRQISAASSTESYEELLATATRSAFADPAGDYTKPSCEATSTPSSPDTYCSVATGTFSGTPCNVPNSMADDLAVTAIKTFPMNYAGYTSPTKSPASSSASGELCDVRTSLGLSEGSDMLSLQDQQYCTFPYICSANTTSLDYTMSPAPAYTSASQTYTQGVHHAEEPWLVASTNTVPRPQSIATTLPAAGVAGSRATSPQDWKESTTEAFLSSGIAPASKSSRRVKNYRVAINQRLRNRSKDLRVGLQQLRDIVPTSADETHMTTGQLLRRATYYMKFLSDTLAQAN
eukprot:scpid52561/ scgid34446/ 